MSRSFKKHFFYSFCGNGNGKWLKDMHRAYRSKERDVLKYQELHPEDDLVYPVFKEVANIYDSPNDGHPVFGYYNFEHYIWEEEHPGWWGRFRKEIPSREEMYLSWIRLFGK